LFFIGFPESETASVYLQAIETLHKIRMGQKPGGVFLINKETVFKYFPQFAVQRCSTVYIVHYFQLLRATVEIFSYNHMSHNANCLLSKRVLLGGGLVSLHKLNAGKGMKLLYHFVDMYVSSFDQQSVGVRINSSGLTCFSLTLQF
jgi:hypothetical protein